MLPVRGFLTPSVENKEERWSRRKECYKWWWSAERVTDGRSEEAGDAPHSSTRVAAPLLSWTAAPSLMTCWHWRPGQHPGSADQGHCCSCRTGLFPARWGMTALIGLRDRRDACQDQLEHRSALQLFYISSIYPQSSQINRQKQSVHRDVSQAFRVSPSLWACHLAHSFLFYVPSLALGYFGQKAWSCSRCTSVTPSYLSRKMRCWSPW